jgi:putative ABC transport system substrate-binding protein
MKRRKFIALTGFVAATRPLAARAQQPIRVRRIGVLMSAAADDEFGQTWSAAFTQGMQQLGWEVGRNVQIDYRWGANDTERFHKYAAELVALSPDVIVGTAASIVGALQQASRTIPIVFVATIDPVGSGLVASLARPGGNATGFAFIEFSLSAKLLELLKEVAPGVTRVAVVRDPFVPAGSGGFAAIQTEARACRWAPRLPIARTRRLRYAAVFQAALRDKPVLYKKMGMPEIKNNSSHHLRTTGNQ